MKKLCIFFLVTSLFALITCAEKPDTEADIEAINSLTKEVLRSWNEGDFEGYMALIDDDAMFLPPNAPMFTGMETIRSVYRSEFDQYTFDLTISTEEIQVCGDWAFGRENWIGSMTPKDGGEPIMFNNKNLVIYRRQPDGSWKTWRAIYNSNTAPSAQ